MELAPVETLMDVMLFYLFFFLGDQRKHWS